MTTVFVPKEVQEGETRVAATPETVKRMTKLGLKVTVEPGAGDASNLSDKAYEEAGATIGEAWDADIVVKVAPPQDHPGKGSTRSTSSRRAAC